MSGAQSDVAGSDALARAPFWRIFEISRIPMSLIDRERRYVAINDATLALYGYPRENLLGTIAGSTAVQGDRSADEDDWDMLLRTGELFGERAVADADGVPLRVSYAAHATTIAGRWLALCVTVSAQTQGDARPTLEAVGVTRRDPREPKLTRRECDVVRLLVLGATTSEVAAKLVVSADTVRSHVRNAMAKTGARTRAQLVAIALAQELADN